MSSISKKKNILLATGIFPPDVGGPSTYVFELAKELLEKGHSVSVVTYGDGQLKMKNEKLKITLISRGQNIFLRYLKYFLAVWQQSKQADCVVAFDLSSSGLPSALVAKLRRKKIFVRLGGDFLWEKAFARGWTDKPLDEFYTQKKNVVLLLYYFINRILLKFFNKVVFTSNWQKDIYLKYYKLAEKKTAIIKNSFFQKDEKQKSKARNKKLIFAGRLIKLKNLERVIEAVVSLPELMFDIYGEGPEQSNLQLKIKKEKIEDRVRVLSKLSHSEFMLKLGEAYTAIVPSVSEISPVTMMECIKLGKPVIVTEKCGYFEDFKNDLLFIDPLNVDDIKAKLELVYTEIYYDQYMEKMKKIDTSRDYAVVAGEWMELLCHSGGAKRNPESRG